MSVLHLRRDMVVDDDALDGPSPPSPAQGFAPPESGEDAEPVIAGARSRSRRSETGRKPRILKPEPAPSDGAGVENPSEASPTDASFRDESQESARPGTKQSGDAAPVVEIEAALPIPLRRYEQPVEIEARIISPEPVVADDETEGEPIISRLWSWARIAAAAAVLAAYPVMIAASSDVGDRNIDTIVDRTQWSAPWAGAAAVVMERHFAELGWANDAPAWSPMARLTAKPAYQAALGEAIGEFVALRAQQEAEAGRQDSDLAAAARLVSAASTGAQLRAARDALVNHDRRLRRLDTAPATQPAHIAQQLVLLDSWAAHSQSELAGASAVLGGSPMDDVATRAVYAAKGRALAAYVFLAAMHWPSDSGAAAARTAALDAWRAAAEFRPLVVLNGSPDSSLFGNHPAAMGFLMLQAQRATAAYLSAIPAPAAAVVEATPAPAAS